VRNLHIQGRAVSLPSTRANPSQVKTPPTRGRPILCPRSGPHWLPPDARTRTTRPKRLGVCLACVSLLYCPAQPPSSSCLRRDTEPPRIGPFPPSCWFARSLGQIPLLLASLLRALRRTRMEGYTKLAALMGAYPEVAIVRRFAALQMQRILYLQAELVDLESQLRDIEEGDRLSGDEERQDCAFDWLALSDYREPGSPVPPTNGPIPGRPPPNDPVSGTASGGLPQTASTSPPRNRRWALMGEINRKLKEYSKHHSC